MSRRDVGQDVSVVYFATGTGLLWVGVDWGDGSTRLLRGFRTRPYEVLDDAVYVYLATGTYQVVGEAISTDGSAFDTLTITIN